MYDHRHRVQAKEPLRVAARVKVNIPGLLPSYGEVVAANGRKVVVIERMDNCSEENDRKW